MFNYGNANEAQKEAISATDGLVLITAGPGTGKTFTLVKRAVYLIQECGIQPEQIMMATFTEKAAKELKEKMPQFSGGSVQLWIKENLRYPEIARENNIQGKVYVKCIIDSEGNVCNAEIQRGGDPSLNKEALRLVNSMPKWKPGMQNGKTVSIPYVIIVEFKLN